MNKCKWLLVFTVFLSVNVFADDEMISRVVTHQTNPVKCITSLHVTQIDGKNRMLPGTGFEIEPGWHTMHGRYTVNLRNCEPAEEESRRPVRIPPLEWLFEPGKVYYIGVDYSSPSRKNWRIVVWKTKWIDESLNEPDED